MLQINSGKFYQNGVGRHNRLRGVLYSNLLFTAMNDDRIVTAAGTLLQADYHSYPRPIVYELFEQIEKSGIEPLGIASHGIQPYLNDFSAIVSFILRSICTPDYNLSDRLLSERRALGVNTPARKLVKRVFDENIIVKSDDFEILISFVKELIGLERKSFLAAMRAIRTYVTATHRICDDLELSYTLFVASIESLAQKFDGHQAQWCDYDESRRGRIDKALENADAKVSENVRSAILKNEHVALARRFRDFSLSNMPQSILREPGRSGAPGWFDLRDGLKNAYQLRSGYIHNLRDLPRLLDSDLSYRETIRIDHVVYLTLEGLSRAVRAIILGFVSSQRKIDLERYNYHSEKFGIIQMPIASRYWYGNAEYLIAETGRQWLEILLEQIAAQLLTGSVLTDISHVFLAIEDMLPNLHHNHKKPIFALYYICNCIFPRELRSPNFEQTVNSNDDMASSPSLESLAAYVILDVEPTWHIQEHDDLVKEYFDKRNTKNGFRIPELFEACMILSLAERYRAAGNIDRAMTLLSIAASNALTFQALQSIERDFAPHLPINWRILLPNTDPKAVEPQRTSPPEESNNSEETPVCAIEEMSKGQSL